MSLDELGHVRVRDVLTEIGAGRIGRGRSSIEAYVDEVFSIPRPEAERIVARVLEYTGETSRGKAKMNEPNVLKGKALDRAAAKILRQNPAATATEIYRELTRTHKVGVSCSAFVGSLGAAERSGDIELDRAEVEDEVRKHLTLHPQATTSEVWGAVSRVGTPQMKKSSFGTTIMPLIRKELGIVFARSRGGTKSKGATKQPAAPPRPARVTMDVTLPAAMEDEPPATETKVPVPETKALPPETIAPIDDTKGLDPETTASAAVALVDSPSRILVEAGGSRCEATKSGDEWRVAFDGAVSGSLIRDLFAAVLEGIG